MTTPTNSVFDLVPQDVRILPSRVFLLTDCADTEAMGRTLIHTPVRLGVPSVLSMRPWDPIGSIATLIASTAREVAANGPQDELTIIIANHAPRRPGDPEGAPFVATSFAEGRVLVITTLNRVTKTHPINELSYVGDLLKSSGSHKGGSPLFRVQIPEFRGTSFRSRFLGLVAERIVRPSSEKLNGDRVPLDSLPDSPSGTVVYWIDEIRDRKIGEKDPRNIKLWRPAGGFPFEKTEASSRFRITIGETSHVAVLTPRVGEGDQTELIVAPSSTLGTDGQLYDLFVPDGCAARLFDPGLRSGTPVKIEKME